MNGNFPIWGKANVSFTKLFHEIRIAELEHSQDINLSYELRYQVYCEDRGFLNKSNYPDNRETDQYDRISTHIGCYFPSSDGVDQLAGSVRLVHQVDGHLPLLDYCTIDQRYRHLLKNRADVIEVSRMCVSSAFRRFTSEKILESPISSRNTMRHKASRSAFLLSLLKGVYQASKQRGITHWLIAVEASLFKILRKSSIYFDAIGPEIDYYGPVKPYMANIQAVEQGLFRGNPDYLHYINNGLEGKYQCNLLPLMNAKPEQLATV